MSITKLRKTCENRRYDSGETEGDKANFMLAPEDEGYVLTWNRGQTMVSVPIDEYTNLPMVSTKASYEGFACFCKGFKAFPTIIPDDEDEEYHEEPIPQPEAANVDSVPIDASEDEARECSFSNEPNENEPVTKIDDPLTPRDKAMFLSWHIRMGHAPFKIVRWAAQLGLIPKKLRHCTNEVCPACMYGKQKRRPWRSKGQTAKNARPIKRAKAPGECVSVDQLISSVPGLVGQTTGKLTKQRLYVATIFVDHFSGLDYVHVQESTSAEDTLEAKAAFEQMADQAGIKIQHYHCDNGIFASNGFREAVLEAKQTISFCGVGA